ncbi:MAG: redoxin domain-containing protein [Chloroflexota bacterium]
MKRQIMASFCLVVILSLSCISFNGEKPSPEIDAAIDTPSPAANPQTNAERPLYTAGEPDPSSPNTAMEVDLYASEAPEFPDDLVWLNTDQHPPIQLADIRGKVAILMFWSYECIDCLYHFQDLQRLQEEHPQDLVIISIHSAKLDSEDDLVRVKQTIANYQANYPTIDDQDQRLWYKWGAQGIPTFVVIDPVGAIYGLHNGENVYGTFKPVLKLFTKD